MKNFSGRVLFLDRDDINTDEIIPARYLTEITKAALKPHLLEDLSLEEFDPQTDIVHTSAIVTRSNFGCGSSREHAPWALEVNGIHLVVAESFARIFRQNMLNCGMLVLALPTDTINMLFTEFAGLETYVEMDLESQELTFRADDRHERIAFELSGFDRELVRAGGWLEYADTHY